LVWGHSNIGKTLAGTECGRRLQLASNVDAAFDRERFQLALLESSVLSVSGQDSRALATPIPNPFFLPAQFLILDDDLCPACALHLADARQSELWSKPGRCGARPSG
jgi:hypothetical protein